MKHIRSLMKKVRRGEGGFTLIEVLVVVAILGAIAAVVVLNVGGFIGRGVCEGYCTEKHNVQTAVIAVATANTSIAVGDVTWEQAQEFLATTPKYQWAGAWPIDPDTGKISDASDMPTPQCDGKC